MNKARKTTKRKSKPGNRKRKKVAAKVPVLIPQSNGGALLSGGIPGRSGPAKGSGGRPPDMIRQRCRESFDKRIPILERIADDKLKKSSEQPRVRDRIMALDALAKHGFGTGTQIVAAQMESPEGRKFTLILGELIPGAAAAERGPCASAKSRA